MASLTEGTGFLIAAVRTLVRDAIAALVSRLTVYAAEAAFSLGTLTPLIVQQATTLTHVFERSSTTISDRCGSLSFRRTHGSRPSRSSVTTSSTPGGVSFPTGNTRHR